MSFKKLVVRNFTGGIGTAGEKNDVPNSYRFAKNINPFEDPSYLIPSRKTTKVSGSTVTTLPTWAEDGSPWSTDRYFYDKGGKIYKETSGGSWSSLRTVSNSSGEGFKVFDDYLYYALDEELGRYGLLSGTPAFDDSFLSDGTTNVDQTGGGTGATDYTTTTSINEGATHRQTFTPTLDPLKAVIIDVDVVGTGDWTLTIHDKNNVSIGSATIVNGSMSTGDVTFTFTNPLRIVPDNEYHFHVTSTVADGGVDTNVNNDLEGAEFSTLFGILISAVFHPMVEHLNQLVIGNERYLSTWDQALYSPNRVILPPGFEVRSLARFEEFVVAACFKGSSIDSSEEARLYFWDGISTTYNFYSDVTVGAPNAIHNSKGSLVGVYGSNGSMYVGHDPFEDIVSGVPKLTRGKKVEVFPGAITEHEGRSLVGVAGSTDDGTNLEQGVYEFGRQQNEFPEVLNFPYIISTGTTSATTLKIGMVKSMGTDLYIGWDDNGTFGVDKVALGDNGAASCEWESLIFDGGSPDKQMLPINLIIEFESLAANQTITPKYKLDRASSFTSGTAVSTVGATRAEEGIYNRSKEIEIGFTMSTTDGTFPKITAVILEYDDLSREAQE